MSTPQLGDRSRPSTVARTPRQRQWFFEVRDRKIYLLRNGDELSSFSAMKMGMIMDVTTGNKHCSKGAKLDAADNALLVSCEAQLNFNNHRGIQCNQAREQNFFYFRI